MTERDNDLDQRVDQLLKAVGDRFARARSAKGVGPVTLHEVTGLSRNSLRELEQGENVTLKTLLRATLALDINPAELFEDRGNAQAAVTKVTAALAALLTALPADVRQAAEELAADLASNQVINSPE